jgi:hypothetical protein
MKRHDKRFIVEVQMCDGEGKEKWYRSGTEGLDRFFSTREEAQAALDPAKDYISEDLKYRVRQK